jgi:hypothetical protein
MIPIPLGLAIVGPIWCNSSPRAGQENFFWAIASGMKNQGNEKKGFGYLAFMDACFS